MGITVYFGRMSATSMEPEPQAADVGRNECNSGCHRAISLLGRAICASAIGIILWYCGVGATDTKAVRSTAPSRIRRPPGAYAGTTRIAGPTSDMTGRVVGIRVYPEPSPRVNAGPGQL